MAKIICSTKDMERGEWLQWRSKGIGGSDASIILGLNKYKTAFELWLEKTGQVELEENQSEAAYFGTLFEDLVSKEYEKRSGNKVRKRNAMFVHEEHPFMFANVDRLIVGRNGGFEAKTASEYLLKEWEGEEIPAAYLIQCQHYMAVMGLEFWDIAAIVGGNKYREKRIMRDEELINMIIEAEKNFWYEYVLGGKAPFIEGSEAAVKFVNKRYSWGIDGEIIDLKAEHKDNIEKYLQVKAILKDYETEKNRLENLLKMDLGENQAGTVGKWAVTWKNSSRSGIDGKKLAELYPEIAEEVKTKITMRKFAIKEAK